jgi:hypothetical protein
MKRWYKKYVELMLRTRWLTLLGAGISALVVPMHLFQFQANVEIAEVIDRSEIYGAAVPELVTLAIVGLAFALRFAIVAKIQQKSYLLATASWAGVIVLMVFYFWLDLRYEYDSIAYPNSGIHYGIYDTMTTSTPVVNIVFLLNFLLGSIRAFTTAVIALITPKRIAK